MASIIKNDRENMSFPRKKDVSAFDLLILDIKYIVKCFNHISISFVKRSANQSAHKLAREAVYMSDCREWMFTPPPFICNSILRDLV